MAKVEYDCIYPQGDTETRTFKRFETVCVAGEPYLQAYHAPYYDARGVLTHHSMMHGHMRPWKSVGKLQARPLASYTAMNKVMTEALGDPYAAHYWANRGYGRRKTRRTKKTQKKRRTSKQKSTIRSS